MSQYFSHQNLQYRSFKGQDLTGANFSYADIRGANFTNAILRNANFSYTQAGLHRQGVISWSIASLVFSAMTGWLLVETGAAVGSMLTLEFTSKYSIIPGAIVLILLTLACIVTIHQGIWKAWIAVAIPWLLTIGWAMCLAGSLAGDGSYILLAISFLTGILLAATRSSQPKKTIAIVLAGAIAVALPVFLAGAFFGNKVVVDAIYASYFYPVLFAICAPNLCAFAATIARSVGGNFGVAIVWAVAAVSVLVVSRGFPVMLAGHSHLISPLASFVALTVVVTIGLLSVYISWRIVAKHEEFDWDGFITLSGYTDFCSADLTDADFTGASLQQTDFTKAILAGTCWEGAKNIDRAKFDRSIRN